MHPVPVPSNIFEVWSIDFITGLPEINGYNTLMTVTDKFSKAVCLIPGKDSWSAQQWAYALWANVICDWGLPMAIISDRDSKFTGSFWRELMGACHIKLWMTAAYHPAADGQLERTNAVVETMLCCLLAGEYESQWFHLLPDIQRNINALPTDATGVSPFEVLHGVKPRSLPNVPGTNNFLVDCFTLQQAIHDSMELAQTRMSMIYDAKHQLPQIGDFAYL